MFDPATLQEYIDNNLVNEAKHPEYPYASYKYTRTAQFKQDWDDITKNCRGLILNTETGEIVARPFSKFFNYSEQKVPAELMQGPIEVTEKLDGSLGIGYVNPSGEFEIASSGSLTSSVAEHATKLYKEKYEGKWEPNPKLTYLWEIISPESIIVVDYHGEDDLYLIGAVNKRNGRSVPIDKLKEWKWKRTQSYPAMQNLDTVINSENRPNHEGYVVHFLNSDARVKFKHEEYVRLHRVATGVNERRIWEVISTSDGSPEALDSWKKNLPEEFLPYIDDIIAKQRGQFNSIQEQAKKIAMISKKENQTDRDLWEEVSKNSPDKFIRSIAMQYAKKGYLTAKTKESIWKQIKPEHTPALWSNQFNAPKN